MKLFSGSSHPALAQAIARELGVELGKVKLKTFSNGEQYVRYEESVRGKDVFLIQTATEQCDSDVLEACLMCQAAKLGFAKSIHLVIPNFPYARQDRVAEPREPISAKLVACLLVTSGADHIITTTLHSDQIQGFFDAPVDNLITQGLFVKYFKEKHLPQPIVVSPDVGGAKAAKKFADALGTDLAIMHKSRPAHQEAEIGRIVGDVAGKTAILYDDMIDTAGSILAAKKVLLKHGANKEMYAVATHGIFSGPAVKRLKEARFREVVVTDSLPLRGKKFPSLRVLSIAPMLAAVIRHVERGQSVTAIYRERKT
jgi:ribose-phosphate pyrophosphokinase